MFNASDIEPLRASLPAFDFHEGIVDSPLLSRYLQHYGLGVDALNEDKTRGIEHAMGFFSSANFKIACHYYRPDNAGGTVFVVHGYYDHVGLFAHIIRYCLARNLAVIAFDLPGHGLSTGPAASIDSFSQYTQVFADCVAMAQAQNLQGPFHVLGQSTGGSIIMDYCLSRCEQSRQEFEHIVLLAPLVRPHDWARGSMLHSVVNVFVKSIGRTFATNSHDDVFLKFLREEDPLQCDRLVSAWVSALKRWLKVFEGYKSCDVSVTIIQGGEDTTVDWRYNLIKIKSKLPNSRVFMLPEGRHHLANESPEIRAQLTSFLDSAL
ncbi:MAG: alpha/beta hydrolase [Gammaproteobacteria bacterium]